jgi:hypothetical protein
MTDPSNISEFERTKPTKTLAQINELIHKIELCAVYNPGPIDPFIVRNQFLSLLLAAKEMKQTFLKGE